MCAVPFGAFGAILGHLMLGHNLSVLSLMGIVGLSGVMVNDSLIMVDYANRLRREEGCSAREAIVLAGVRRFRPILLTTLTTFGGLAPIIFETSRQAQFLIPMSISLAFGILFATPIILLIVPCLYIMVEDLADLRRGFVRWLGLGGEPEAGDGRGGGESRPMPTPDLARTDPSPGGGTGPT